jgi:hypothetical protein
MEATKMIKRLEMDESARFHEAKVAEVMTAIL